MILLQLGLSLWVPCGYSVPHAFPWLQLSLLFSHAGLLSVPITCWPSSLLWPVLCALWIQSVTCCLGFSLSLPGAGLFFPEPSSLSSVLLRPHHLPAADPLMPSWVTGDRVSAVVTQRGTQRPGVLLRVVTSRKCFSKGTAHP